MVSINKVQLLGNLTRDPEIKDTKNGKLARLSVATNKRYRDRDGQMQDATQYHTVVVFQEKIVNVIEEYCKKGSQVFIEGTLEHRSYEDPDGAKKNITEVVIRPYGGDFQLGNRPSGAGDEREQGESRGSRNDRNDDRGRGYDRGGRDDRDNRGGGYNNRDSGRGGYDDLDDDIPF